MTNTNRQCPNCRSELPADAPAGVCPKCLLKAGMNSSVGLTADEATLKNDPHIGGKIEAKPPMQPSIHEHQEPPSIGTKVQYFGDYELMDEIARGGMGVVYKARQVRLNRVVALKMILAGQFASDADVQRFHTEAESAAQLDHPGIVPIFEVGEHEGHHFFSMGLVEGASLAHRITDGPLAPTEAAKLVRKITVAIQYAHEHGVVHRDLKPANILIDRDGQPRVTDFGLAKKVEGDSNLTATGQVLGTPSYMPPEQAAGSTTEVKESADIYSLGAVLYATMTGRAPFVADKPLDILMQVLERDPISPTQLNPVVPRDLATICLKCLQKDRRHRYSSMKQLADDLGRYLNDEPILARPAGRVERCMKWCRRRPTVASLIAVVVVGIIGIIMGGAWHLNALTIERNRANAGWSEADVQRQEAENQRDIANNQRGLADQQRQLAEQRERLARRYWYIADMQLGHQEWHANNPGRVMELLKRHQPVDDGEDLRGFEWRYLHQLCNSAEAIQPDHDSEVYCVRYSPDGRRIVSTGTFDKTVRIRDAKSGETKTVLKGHPAIVYDALFTNDGQRVISCGKDRTIRIWDQASGNVVTTLKSDVMPVRIALSTDESLIAATGVGGIEVWSLKSEERTHRIKKPVCSAVEFHPDGQTIAFADRQHVDGKYSSGVVLWDLMKQEKVVFLSGHNKSVVDIEFSADGKTMVTGSGDHTAKIWNVADGDLVRTLTGHELIVSSVSLSPDGTRVATASHDKTIRIWDIETGREMRIFRGHIDLIQSVDFRNDGVSLVSGGKDRTIRIWNIDKGNEVLQIQADEKWAIRRLVFFPNGHLVTGSGGGEVVLWNTQTAKALHRFSGVRGVTMSLGVLRETPPRLAACGLGDSAIHIWPAKGGQKRSMKLEGRGEQFSISPDGTRAAVVDLRGRVSVVHLATGKQVMMDSRHDGPVYAVVWHPDGQTFATGSFDKSIRIWDAQICSQVRTLEGHKLAVVGLAFNSDGSLLASGSASAIEMDQRREPPTPGTIRIWDMTAASPSERILTGHSGGILGLAFSPDDRTLASASHDQTIRLWDPLTGSETMSMTGNSGRFWSVMFSPDGTQLAAGADDGTVYIWNADDLP